jgi:2-succinyl-5-enolpyruvyl-6-hydroxy-3-cyclohexene-1-carboxylate synthase
VTIQVEFARTLVDEWVRAGVRHAVVAPGSRSSPLAIAILSDPRLVVHVRLDERSAAFFALGTALATGVPAVVVTTSGTAVTEVHAAVVEADLARVPLIVVTADRPPELHGVGAPQTVEQVGIFGRAVRFAVDAGVPDAAGRPFWRSLGSRLVAESRSASAGPGPVHANLAFREPLTGPEDPLPAGRDGGAPWHTVVRAPAAPPAAVARFLDLVRGRRGVFLAGGGATRAGEEGPLLALAAVLGWPILADVRALPRVLVDAVIAHGDGIVRSATARTKLAPEIIVHLGSPHASRELSSYLTELAAAGVPSLLIDPFGTFEDPERAVATVIAADPVELCRVARGELGVDDGADAAWLASWRMADDAAERAIADQLAGAEAPTEPGLARALYRELSPGSVLVASSSMPVRDLEWFAARRAGAPLVLANRGANGIDGVTSTMLGVAAAMPAPRVVGVIGDLAFFHDLSGLVWGRHETVPNLTLVVLDNDGGGIFNFLAYPDQLGETLFERGFATPQRASAAVVAAALGWPVEEVEDPVALAGALARAADADGISVVVVRTARRANVTLHATLNAAVVAAVDGALAG